MPDCTPPNGVLHENLNSRLEIFPFRLFLSTTELNNSVEDYNSSRVGVVWCVWTVVLRSVYIAYFRSHRLPICFPAKCMTPFSISLLLSLAEKKGTIGLPLDTLIRPRYHHYRCKTFLVKPFTAFYSSTLEDFVTEANYGKNISIQTDYRGQVTVHSYPLK